MSRRTITYAGRIRGRSRAGTLRTKRPFTGEESSSARNGLRETTILHRSDTECRAMHPRREKSGESKWETESFNGRGNWRVIGVT